MLRLVSYQKAVPRPIQPLFHSKGDGKGPFYLFISKSKMSCSKRFLKGFSLSLIHICTMKLYNNPDAGCSSKTCCSIRDVEDARSVAVRLGMPYFVFNYMDEFRRDVMETFARSYTCLLYTSSASADDCYQARQKRCSAAVYGRIRSLKGCTMKRCFIVQPFFLCLCLG